MFACSLPTSTSTWHSDHRIRPGGYMSGELKLENINTEGAPTRRSHHPAKDPQSSYHIQPRFRKILVPCTRLFYSTRKTLKTIQPKTLLNQQDPHGLLFILECNYDRQPRILPEISNRVQDYNTLLLINFERIPLRSK
jgi:hypothetical protein